MHPPAQPSCERCLFYSESAGPDGLMWCAKLAAWLSELEPACNGEQFQAREPMPAAGDTDA